MCELKENGKVLTSKSVGTGPSSYKKKIYRAAISQRLRNTDLDDSKAAVGTLSVCVLLLLSDRFLSRFPGWHMMSPPASLAPLPRGRERLTVSCAQSAVLVQHSALQEVQHREIIRRAINVYTALGSIGPREHPTLTNRQALTALFIDMISPLCLSFTPPPPTTNFKAISFSFIDPNVANLYCCCSTVRYLLEPPDFTVRCKSGLAFSAIFTSRRVIATDVSARFSE